MHNNDIQLCQNMTLLNNQTQDLSSSVLAVMELLQLEQVIMLGVGAGANIAARVALAAPNKVDIF